VKLQLPKQIRRDLLLLVGFTHETAT
jgi:hypothetical protein